MKIIILAAGKGERLWPLTKNTPKPLLTIGNGNTLIEEQIGRIAESGVIDDVVVVTGYLADQIDAKVSTLDCAPLVVRTLFNPFYECSNNLASLWVARGEMGTDFMVTNGDNLFDAGVFKEFAEASTAGGIYLSVSPKSEFDDDDMKVALDRGVVREVRKSIPVDQASAESPGLALVVGPRHREVFLGQLDRLMRDKACLSTFWLEVFNQLYANGVEVKPWAFDATGRWREVDVHPDVHHLERFLKEAK
jgi:choline kinase